MAVSIQSHPGWLFAVAIAAVVAVLAAILLLTIIVLARHIARLARTALGAVQQIEANTRPIWSISATNIVAEDLLAGAQAIERNAWAIAEAASHSARDSAA